MNRQPIISNRSLPLEFNADGLPARIHIVPRGELHNNEAGVTQVLDDKALNSILADLRNRHAANGGLYMGEEHFIYDADKSSQAFAWGKEFGLDAKGIWATKYDTTDVGEPALKNKRFKFTSFAADPKTPGALEKVAPGKVRVLKIDTVGFTNFPNGKGMLQPMSNRSLRMAADGKCPDCGCAGETCDEAGKLYCPDCGKNFADSVSAEPAANQKQNNQEKKMKNIATKLGLAAEASEDAILAEVTKLQNRATAAEAEVTPLKNRKTELETENQTLLGEQCEAILDGCGLKADDKRRAHLVNSLKPLKNREARLAHLADFGIKPVAATASKPQHLLNRGDGKQAEAGTETDATKLAAQAESEINTYKLTNRCSYGEARNAVRALKPELFGLKTN